MQTFSCGQLIAPTGAECQISICRVVKGGISCILYLVSCILHLVSCILYLVSCILYLLSSLPCLLSFCSLIQQAHRVAGHAFAGAGEAQVFFRGGFYIDTACIDAHGSGNVLLHGFNVGTQLGALGDHGHIDIADPVTGLSDR